MKMTRDSPSLLRKSRRVVIVWVTMFTSIVSQFGCDVLLNDDSDRSTQPFEHFVDEQGWYGWLPIGFPIPKVPKNNPMTAEKIELGRYLFYDQRLSGNRTQSCSSCHDPALAFTEKQQHSTGSTGDRVPRNSMALINVAYNSAFTWANPALDTLERQIAVPLLADLPIELGIAGREAEILSRLADEPTYQILFSEAYPDIQEPFQLGHVIDSLACFVRSLVSGNSPFDRMTYLGEDTLSGSAHRGLELFYSERLECHHCHGGFNFSFSTTHQNSSVQELAYHNTGLYNLDAMGRYPEENLGLFLITGDPSDMGKFRAPTLRNVAVTGPYMHDGSIATLEEVIQTYEEGGRLIEDGMYQGDGRVNPYKSPFVHGFRLNERERADLVAFLESLTDQTFLTNPSFQDPWKQKR